MSNVFDLFQNTRDKNQVQVDITAGFYDTTPQHTAEVIHRMEQHFKDIPPFDAQAFIAAFRQKLKEPGQAVIVIDSFSPMAT
jgi:hypothetical protein